MKTLTKEQINEVSGGGFTDTSPGWGETIGGILRGRFGVPGVLVGNAAGHAIETKDYEQLGEYYKQQVAKEVASGVYPVD